MAQNVVGDYVPTAQKAWREMVASYIAKDAALESTVTLVSNDNWMEYTVRYVIDYKKRRSTNDVLFSRILDEFDRSGGALAVASMTVHLVETPTMQVRLSESRQ